MLRVGLSFVSSTFYSITMFRSGDTRLCGLTGSGMSAFASGRVTCTDTIDRGCLSLERADASSCTCFDGFYTVLKALTLSSCSFAAPLTAGMPPVMDLAAPKFLDCGECSRNEMA